MSRFYRVLRMVVLISVGVVLSVYIAVAALYRSNWPHRFVVSVTERELSKAFGRPVQIRSMTGNLFTSATFHEVSFMDTVNTGNYLFKIRHVQATYTPLELLAHARDIMPAIRTLILEDVDLQFVRSVDNRWNFFEFIAPPLKPGQPPPPPPTFRGKIIVRNLHGGYWDYRGFSEAPLSQPFEASIDGATGVIDFANHKRVTIHLSGQVAQGYTDAILSGWANVLNGAYQFRFESKPMALSAWAHYVFPFKGYEIPTGDLYVSGMIRSIPDPRRSTLPFSPVLKMTVQNAQFQMPMFPTRFEHVNARLRMDGSQASVEWGAAVANGIPLSANGQIRFHDPAIQMSVRSETFDLAALKALFPSTREWKYSGEAIAQFGVTGPLAAPIVEGTVQADAQVYAFGVKQNMTRFTYQNQHLRYALLNGTLYGGQLRGGGEIDFSTASPELDADLELFGSDIDLVFPAISEHLGGTFDAKVNLDGTLRDFTGHVVLRSSGMTAFQQSIARMEVPFRVLRTADIAVSDGQIQLNGSRAPLSFSGEIQNLYALNFSFSGIDIGLKDFGKSLDSQRGTLPTVSGEVSGTLDALFWSHPLQAIHASVDMTIHDWRLYDYGVASGSATFRWDVGDITIDRMTLQNPEEFLSISGLVRQGVPQHLNIQAEGIHVATGSIIQSWLMPSLKATTGIVSLQAVVRHRQGADSPNLPLVSRMDADGHIRVSDGQVLGQNFDQWVAVGAWNRTGLVIDKTEFQVGTTNVKASGKILESGRLALDILPGSYLRLGDLAPSLKKWGQFLGEGTVSGKVGGSFGQPSVNVVIAFPVFEYNRMTFPRVTGDIQFSNRRVTSTHLQVGVGTGTLSVSGFLDFSKVVFEDENPYLNLSCDVQFQGDDIRLSDLGALVGTAKTAANRGQTTTTLPVATVASKGLFTLGSQLASPTTPNMPMVVYAAPLEGTWLGYYEKMALAQERRQAAAKTAYEVPYGGLLEGTLSFCFTPGKDARLTADIGIADFQYGDIYMQQLLLKSTANPQGNGLMVDLNAKKGELGGRQFDQLSLSAAYLRGILNITKTDIRVGSRTNTNLLNGSFPIAGYWDDRFKDQPMRLQVVLSGDDIGVLSVFTPYLNTITNKGKVTLLLDGTLRRPLVNSSQVELQEAQITFSDLTIFRSPFRVPSDNTVTIKDNVITIPGLELEWSGEDTRSYSDGKIKLNHLVVSGTVTLTDLTLLSPETVGIQFDMSVRDTLLAVKFPAFYQGNVQLSNVTVRGIYPVAFTQLARQRLFTTVGTDAELGPTIGGWIGLSEGRITIPSLGERVVKPSLRFALQAAIYDKVWVEGSLFGEGILATLANQFDLRLAAGAPPLYIGGTLNAPRIDGKINLDSGTAYFINRSFELLTLERQSAFQQDRAERGEVNQLSFIQESIRGTAAKRLVPVLDIRALTVIEKPTSPNVLPEYQGVILRIDGPLSRLESVSFLEYQLENPYSAGVRAEFVRAYTIGSGASEISGIQSQQLSDVVHLLLPELDPGYADPGNPAFIRQLSQNYVRGQFIRPFERNIAQRTGLYDFRIDYDVGGNVLRSVGWQSGDHVRDQVGISVIKELLSSQLFLRVKTNLDLSGEAPSGLNEFQLTEYELTYYFLRNLSLNFSNVRQLGDFDFRPHFSLKFSHEF